MNNSLSDMMQRALIAAVRVILAISGGQVSGAETPIQLHPQNPHYFLWRGQPAVLMTSGEHYGAILNRAFDFKAYLDVLETHGFNLTRVFSGAYREVEGSFNIKENTLAPRADEFMAPWARSSSAGARDGGNKFDLDRWDPAYFERIKAFLSEANKRGIVVEYIFFCTMYNEDLWRASPLNRGNNINQVGNVGPYEVYSGKDATLQQVQENLVRKVVTELNAFPNLYYEICNEPYERGGLTAEWNDRIIEVIREAESTFENKHLIAQGFNAESSRVASFNPAVSILNFHAAGANNALENYEHNRALADDETGGKRTHPLAYRREAWEFMLSGGAVFNHLDFSFTVANPGGTHLLTNEPGGGGPDMRAQLSVLKKFLESLDFIGMRPNSSFIRVLRPENLRTASLSNPGKAYVVYIAGKGPCEVELSVSPGNYRSRWLDPTTGRTVKENSLVSSAGTLRLISSALDGDLVLSVRRE